MGHIIHNPKIWEHLEDRSSYNHNFYRNPETGEVVLEECDDDVWCDYYLIVDGREEYIGFRYWDDIVFGETEEDIELWNQ